jgi:hypothetical protein
LLPDAPVTGMAVLETRIVQTIQDAIRMGQPVVHLGVLPVRAVMSAAIARDTTATIQTACGHLARDRGDVATAIRFASIVSAQTVAMSVPV